MRAQALLVTLLVIAILVSGAAVPSVHIIYHTIIVGENEVNIYEGDILNISTALRSIGNMSVSFEQQLILVYKNGSNYWFEIDAMQMNESNRTINTIIIRYMELHVKGNDSSSVLITTVVNGSLDDQLYHGMATFLYYSNTSIDVLGWIGDVVVINKTLNLLEHYTMLSTLLKELAGKYKTNTTDPQQKFLYTAYNTLQKALYNITLLLNLAEIETGLNINKPVQKSISFAVDPINDIVRRKVLIDGAGSGPGKGRTESTSLTKQAEKRWEDVAEKISEALDVLPQNWKLFVGCLMLSIATILPRTLPGMLLGLTLSFIIATAIITIPRLLNEVGEHVSNPFTIKTAIKKIFGEITKAGIETILSVAKQSSSIKEFLEKLPKQLIKGIVKGGIKSIEKSLSLSKLTIGSSIDRTTFSKWLANWKLVLTLALIVLVGGIVYYADEKDYLGWVWSPWGGWHHLEWWEDIIVGGMIWALRQIAKAVIYNNLVMTLANIMRTAGLGLSLVSAVFTIGFSIVMGIITITFIKTLDYIIEHTSNEEKMTIDIRDLENYLKEQIMDPKLVIDVILCSLIGI